MKWKLWQLFVWCANFNGHCQWSSIQTEFIFGICLIETLFMFFLPVFCVSLNFLMFSTCLRDARVCDNLICNRIWNEQLVCLHRFAFVCIWKTYTMHSILRKVWLSLERFIIKAFEECKQMREREFSFDFRNKYIDYNIYFASCKHFVMTLQSEKNFENLEQYKAQKPRNNITNW